MQNPIIYTEAELVNGLKNHEGHAFCYLYDNYSAALFGEIKRIVTDRHLAEDVLQESFIKIHQNITVYDRSRSRLYTWLLAVTKNVAIDMVRSKACRQMRIHSDFETSTSEIAAKMGVQIDHIGVRKTLGLLKKEHTQVIELAYFKGYTQQEISVLLNTPLNTIKTRTRAGLKQLKGIMDF